MVASFLKMRSGVTMFCTLAGCLGAGAGSELSVSRMKAAIRRSFAFMYSKAACSLAAGCGRSACSGRGCLAALCAVARSVAGPASLLAPGGARRRAVNGVPRGGGGMPCEASGSWVDMPLCRVKGLVCDPG